MTYSLISDYLPIADILGEESNSNIEINQQGIDTIELIGRYESVIKLVERLGLSIEPMPNSSNIYDSIEYEIKNDNSKRLNQEAFKPIVERVRLPKVSPWDKSLYIGIVRNTPTLFNVAEHHKKRKDTYCKLVFAGLNQPSKKISSEAIKIISRFLKRKTFKLHSLDIAIDSQKEDSISFKDKGTFRNDLMPFSEKGVISKGSSLYVNQIEHPFISRIIYYDKYKKQLKPQGKEIIGDDLKDWRRLEIRLTYDVTEYKHMNFTRYIDGFNFLNDLYDVQDIAYKIGAKNYDTDYLIYQLNSFIDNRFMNNRESKEQFNSVEALERFKTSDFRRYILAI